MRLRPLPTVLVATLTGLMCWAGNWQYQKADKKRVLLAAYAHDQGTNPWPERGARVEPYARVWLQGHFESDRQVYLDGMTHQRQVGYQVLTPFRLADGGLVIVNRGWRKWDGPRDQLPALPAPAGERRVAGRVSPFFEPGLRLAGGNEDEAAAWPRLAVYPKAKELAEWLGEEVDPNMLLLSPDEAGGFVRQWRPAEIPPSRHMGYALQWYSFAVVLVALFIVASRETREVKGNGKIG